MYVQVEILAHSGGKDAKDVTRRCLSRTITPPVAKQINWTGLGTLGKRPFQHHKLVEVIKGIYHIAQPHCFLFVYFVLYNHFILFIHAYIHRNSIATQ